MATRVLTVLGEDRPGIVAEISDVLTARGGSWVTSEMTRLAGQFAGVVLVEVPDEEAARLQVDLEALAGEALRVTVSASGEAPVASAGWWRASLSLVGQDRPGVVQHLAGVVADHGVTIERLHTDTRDAPMAGGVLFEAEAVLALPDGVDLGVLQRALETIGDELMVDIELTPDGDPRA